MKNLAILSNLKSCQFAPKNSDLQSLYMFANLRIHRLFLPKIISYEPSQHLTVTNEGLIFLQYIFSLTFGT